MLGSMHTDRDACLRAIAAKDARGLEGDADVHCDAALEREVDRAGG